LYFDLEANLCSKGGLLLDDGMEWIMEWIDGWIDGWIDIYKAIVGAEQKASQVRLLISL